MTAPTIALFSDHCQTASDLRRQLESDFPIHVCRGPLSRLPDEVSGLRPEGLVVDFTQAGGGGHAECQVLETIQDANRELPIIMIAGDDCPEPLARRAACTSLTRLVDSPPMRLVAEAARRMFAAACDDGPACRSPGGSYSEVVVRGATRAFETSTLSMKLMLQELELAAGHDVTVLLIGETGVGKTYLGRLIHEISPRREQPFLTVACGALPDDLIESELFGHSQGAFTGAHADKDGKFIAAGGGTILLDEIDVLGPEQQVKLLRVIETGEFEPVGSNRTLKSAARLVVASNLELEPLVEQGKFRADLYYRLNMLKFDIPPLRERTADLPALSEKFVAQHAAKHGVRIDRVEEGLLPALRSYPWPGNVRELENVLRRTVIYCRDGVLSVRHLPAHIRTGTPGPAHSESLKRTARISTASSATQTLGGQIEDTERELIVRALYDHNHSRTKTAKALGISRVTLYNKMRKYEIALN